MTGSRERSVTASEPTSGGIELTVRGYKVKGVKIADLSWSGTSSPDVDIDIHRDGIVVATTANDGAYTDSTGKKGGNSYMYMICEASTATCSNETTATF